MGTPHRRDGSYYECGHSRADHINTSACRSVKTTVVDELIARRLLEALAPEEIALAGADEVADRRALNSLSGAATRRTPAARRSGPSARSACASMRTGWSLAASRADGSRSSGSSPKQRPTHHSRGLSLALDLVTASP
jgi:hypothetical protein